MSRQGFMDLLQDRWDEGKFLCVGLDSDQAKLPASLHPRISVDARRLDCDILGVATLAGVTAANAVMLNVPTLNALCVVDVLALPPEEVPPEFQWLPTVCDESLGHGAAYKQAHPEYPGGYTTLLPTLA